MSTNSSTIVSTGTDALYVAHLRNQLACKNMEIVLQHLLLNGCYRLLQQWRDAETEINLREATHWRDSQLLALKLYSEDTTRQAQLAHDGIWNSAIAACQESLQLSLTEGKALFLQSKEEKTSEYWELLSSVLEAVCKNFNTLKRGIAA